MSEKSLEQRIFSLETEREFEKKIKEEENRQCRSHIERTAEVEEFMTVQKIENEKIKTSIKDVGVQADRAVEKLRYGWMGHLIQAIIVICGFILLYLKMGGVK